MPIIDMHVHLKGRSPCSHLSEQQLYNNLSPRIHGVCITDHWVLKPIKYMLEYDFAVFFGVELTCNSGDILAYGIKRLPSKGLRASQVINFIHEQGGIAACAHPFSGRHFALGEAVYDHDFDAIEINGSIGRKANDEAERAANVMGIPTIGGSDSHSIHHLNTVATHFNDDVHNFSDILEAIKKSECKAVNI